jgi:hypothetical protein
MPYCPTCKQAWPEGQKECPKDHTPLVDELPYQSVQSDPDGTTWVEIASTGVDDRARIIKGFLDAEGIPAQIENVKFSMEPINFGTMGDIRIYVRSEDEARAQELLRQREADFDRLEDDADTIVTDDGTAEVTEDEEIATEPAEKE